MMRSTVGRWATVCCLAAAATTASGGCLPLSLPDLRAIDQLSDADPQRAIGEAQAQLHALGTRSDPMRRAEIQAIVADASMQLSRPDDLRAATMAGLAQMHNTPPSAAALRLRRRFRISESDAAMESGDQAGAEAILTELLAGLPSDSLERSCALVARSMAHAQLNHPDQAAADALTAYRLAEAGNWIPARVYAAYALATVYRRAGLFAKAQAMIEEVIAANRAQGRESSLAVAEFTLGRIFIDADRFTAALAALQDSRALSAGLHDRVGVASADAAICMAQTNLGNLDAAERACTGGDAEFNDAHRTDLLTILQGLRARIDLKRGRTAAAIEKFDRVLVPSSEGLIPYMLPQFHRDRAAAYESLHRYRDAYGDIKAASDLERSAGVAQRERAVAVLSAAAASDRLLTENRALASRLVVERQALAGEERNRRLWVGMSGGALLACGLLAYLLLARRRQSQALRVQETIMRTAARYAPDALLLLDEQRHVRYANRNLFGEATAHPVGEPLGAGLPPAVVPTLESAIDSLVSDRKPLTFTTAVVASDGRTRQFELSGVPVIVDEQLAGMTLRSLDVTEQRRLEREVVDVVSRERQRLSSDLHEGLGQELTGVMLSLRSAMSTIAQGDAGARGIVEESIAHIAECIKMTRDLARGLSPVHIQLGSFKDALRQLAQDASARLKIPVTVALPRGEVTLSNAASDHLYRIVVEAVANAARHARCTTVRIDLSIREDALELVIADDGVGPAQADGRRDGIGLKLMEYRARLLGGSTRFGPGHDGGARVSVSIPLPA